MFLKSIDTFPPLCSGGKRNTLIDIIKDWLAQPVYTAPSPYETFCQNSNKRIHQADVEVKKVDRMQKRRTTKRQMYKLSSDKAKNETKRRVLKCR